MNNFHRAFLLGFDAWANKTCAGQPKMPYAFEGDDELSNAWYNGYNHAAHVHQERRAALEKEFDDN